MEEYSLRVSAIILALLFNFQLGSLSPIWKEGREKRSYTVTNEDETVREINEPSLLQPRGRNPEASTQISSDLFNMVVDYLIDFGYLPEGNATEYMAPNNTYITDDQFPEEVISGLEWFQRQNGLKVTGKLDQETIDALKLPRCGKHEQRMAFKVGAQWKKIILTYKIINSTHLLPEKLVRAELKRAFQLWENVSLLRFEEVGINKTADIDIFFVSGLHGDGPINAFDGPGRVLGHAFFPPHRNAKKPIDGDLHLDNDENWTLNSKKGVNLFHAAAHELGHSLGLDHSTVPKAVMAPTYKGYDPKFQLHNDDIEAIQSVYGKRAVELGNISTTLPAERNLSANETSQKDGKTASTAQLQNPKGGPKQSVIRLCGKEPIDTFVSTKNGSIYVFRGKYFWKLNQGRKPLSPTKGYPQLISTQWKLPSSIDAAVRMQNPLGSQDGKIFFFKGSDYWKFDNDKMEPGYPKKISEGFPGVPNDMEAAFTQPAIIAKGGRIIRGERIFFIKGDQYVLYDTATGNSTHPQSLHEHWVGVQVPINAALSIGNEIVLVSRQQFQKVLLLSYIQDSVFATVQQPKKLQNLLQCEATSTA